MVKRYFMSFFFLNGENILVLIIYICLIENTSCVRSQANQNWDNTPMSHNSQCGRQSVTSIHLIKRIFIQEKKKMIQHQLLCNMVFGAINVTFPILREFFIFSNFIMCHCPLQLQPTKSSLIGLKSQHHHWFTWSVYGSSSLKLVVGIAPTYTVVVTIKWVRTCLSRKDSSCL